MLAASPIEATYLGVPGHDTELDDLSPDGYAHHAHIARDTLRRLDDVEPVDEVDRVTVAAMRERLGLEIEAHEAGYDRMELNVIASPLQGCRDVLRPHADRHPGRLGDHRHPARPGSPRPSSSGPPPCASPPTGAS